MVQITTALLARSKLLSHLLEVTFFFIFFLVVIVIWLLVLRKEPFQEQITDIIKSEALKFTYNVRNTTINLTQLSLVARLFSTSKDFILIDEVIQIIFTETLCVTFLSYGVPEDVLLKYHFY